MFCERLSVGFGVRVSAKISAESDQAGQGTAYGYALNEKRQKAGGKVCIIGKYSEKRFLTFKIYDAS